MEIEVAGEKLQLLPDKAVFWPRATSLIVADIHFGKSAAFRKFGIAVPESTTAHDLHRLDQLVSRTRATRLIILGDFFHAPAGLQPEMMDAVHSWCKKNSSLEIVLVPGNHDKKAGPPPACWNIRNVEDCWHLAPFSFCHDPKDAPDQYTICGHLHPAISLREKHGSSLRIPCFCFGTKRAILPAFGSFTGTQNVKPLAGDRIFAIGADEVAEVFRPPAETLRRKVK
ncbi:MAG: ligase-associated DNA damage response endonuclease PdeM [Verrucomicrobiota bacterium]